MAWNIPGGSGNNGRTPRKRGNANPLDRLLEPLRGVFGGGNGGGASIARWAGLLVAPAAALIGLVLAYPLWSWRRLSAAAYFLRLEMERLQTEGVMVRLGDGPDGSGDFLERRINAVERASRQLRDMHHFVSESLQQLPAPTFVCDARGVILLANLAIGTRRFEHASK